MATQAEHIPTAGGKAESPWRKTRTPNLVEYVPSGTFFLRAKVAGEKILESLETKHYKAATVKLDERLAVLRSNIGTKRAGDVPGTLEGALAIVRASVVNDPVCKGKTRESYLEQLDALKPGKRTAPPATPLARLTASEMKVWWKKTAEIYAPQRANHMLMFVRRALKAARKAGAMLKEHDPSEELKRMKVPRRRLNLLTMEQFKAVVESVRGQKKANSEEAGNWIEFMTYCGLRPGENAEIEWRDIHDDEGVLEIWGGKDRTKNHHMRRVPIIEAMAGLIARMRKGQARVGKIFTLKKPHDALTNACKRLKFPHQRIYDLRHIFATQCNASGVDVPTFSRWLGHRDGGTLAMKTYVHPDDEHSAAAARKVKF